jgi:hypothetical protein
VSQAIATRLSWSREKPFAPQQPWDRNFLLLLVFLMWLGIAVGFGWDVLDHIRTKAPAYPLIVYVHAVVYVGWLAVLTTQVLLIRVRRVDLHRKLGQFAVGLAVVMPPLGLAAAWVSQRLKHGTPDFDPAFFSIQIAIAVAFAVLVAAGFWMRRQSPAHKRLMLLSTIYLSSAGFARWWYFALGDVFGPGFWSFFVTESAGSDLLILALGTYDLVTRGRLHPAFVLGSLWIFATQIVASWLYFEPAWKGIATWLAGY